MGKLAAFRSRDMTFQNVTTYGSKMFFEYATYSWGIALSPGPVTPGSLNFLTRTLPGQTTIKHVAYKDTLARYLPPRGQVQ
jgi:hypothetical protein